MCFVCGVNNDAGTKAEFFVCEKEDGEKVLLTMVQPQDFHQSYPDRMHGGVISALLDESIGRTIQIDNPDIWAVTINLQVKFRKPTPLNQKLYIESKVLNISTRTYDGEGKLFLADGTVCATAAGKFFIVPVEKTFTDSVKQEDYLVTSNEPLPEYIDI